MKNNPSLTQNKHEAKKKPVLTSKSEYHPKKPIITLSNPEDWKWIFSFRFWNQIEYFGLDRTEPKWFISLIEKLKELSQLSKQSVLEDMTTRKNYRYHKIDWNQKNIPIQRTDLNWIDKDYLNNSDEYEMYQFQVSQALGRIVGFWDENLVFNIVLLDPLHNIQPSKSHNYKVDSCNQLTCQYSSLLYDIKNAKSIEEIKTIPSKLNKINVLMHFISEDRNEQIHKLIEEGKVSCIEDILEYGIEYIRDNSE